jgi:hypothetical protein
MEAIKNLIISELHKLFPELYNTLYFGTPQLCIVKMISIKKITNKMGYHENKKIIEACLKCAALCNHCASSCLQEIDIKMMAKCIQLDMECAAICYATAQLLSLGSKHSKAMAKLCAELCQDCHKECKKHENKHCQECSDACKECAEACLSL